jgi:hypothetical protein
MGTLGRRKIDETYNYSEFKRRLKACYDGLLCPEGDKEQHGNPPPA